VVLSGGLKDSAAAEGRSHLWGFPDGRRGGMRNFPLSFDYNLAFALQWTRSRKATGVAEHCQALSVDGAA
jgi:hypothetical protein